MKNLQMKWSRVFFLAAIVILLAMFISAFFTTSASALEQEQIKQCWGGAKDQRGTFTSKAGDGTKTYGSFLIKDPGRIYMNESTGHKLHIKAQSLHIIDAKGDPQQYALGALGYIFRRNVQLGRGGVVSNAKHPDGSSILTILPPRGGIAKVTFDKYCRLVHWQAEGGELPNSMDVTFTHNE